MPLFYFILKTGREKIPDREGLEFPDRDTARGHAEIVVDELMRNRELKTRSWRLEVRDEDLQPSFEILFATVDKSIVHLPPVYRQSVELLSSSTANLLDAFEDVRGTLSNVKETLARADNMIRELRQHRLQGDRS